MRIAHEVLICFIAWAVSLIIVHVYEAMRYNSSEDRAAAVIIVAAIAVVIARYL